MRHFFTFLTCLLVAGCSGGRGGESILEAEAQASGGANNDAVCESVCALTKADVEVVLMQALGEAMIQQVDATISVVDRVGNVLAVASTEQALPFVTVSSTQESGSAVIGGLEGLNFVPATLASVSKAITAAYLSTSGNAFSTRTASQIIQENFNPGELNVPSGPLFGVQFSQLPCGDFVTRYKEGSPASVGPKRSPLGLAADPGGLPLYKGGVPVGGIGVIADGIYGLDKIITNFDQDVDELIAVAGTRGYAAPLEIRADRVTVLGKTLRFTDVGLTDLKSAPDSLEALDELLESKKAQLHEVAGYYSGLSIHPGTAFGTPSSGIRPADNEIFVDQVGDPLDAFVFVDEANRNRFPASDAKDSPGGEPSLALSAIETQLILNEALALANASRAQIRVPAGASARVTVSIVDTQGRVLAIARTTDAPVFGADVSLQKARTAAFFSGTGTLSDHSPADALRSLPVPLYVAPLPNPVNRVTTLTTLAQPSWPLVRYVDQLQRFLGLPRALESSGVQVAFSDRAGGNLSRPHYPDGPSAGPPGPLSKPAGQWSVFSVGLQSDLVYNAIIHHVGFVLGVTDDVGDTCTGNTGLSSIAPFTTSGGTSRLANGIQIFPGSVPIYRGRQLIGGIGVSGDGVDQDDMIAFLAVHRAGEQLDSGVGNAPADIRADRLSIPGQDARLRYVSCPQSPFLDSDVTGVCNGL